MLPRANVIRHFSRSETILSSGYPLFYDRRRIDFQDPAQAIRFGRMRAETKVPLTLVEYQPDSTRDEAILPS
jgi:hypothetical protein